MTYLKILTAEHQIDLNEFVPHPVTWGYIYALQSSAARVYNKLLPALWG